MTAIRSGEVIRTPNQLPKVPAAGFHAVRTQRRHHVTYWVKPRRSDRRYENGRWQEPRASDGILKYLADARDAAEQLVNIIQSAELRFAVAMANVYQENGAPRPLSDASLSRPRCAVIAVAQ